MPRTKRRRSDPGSKSDRVSTRPFSSRNAFATPAAKPDALLVRIIRPSFLTKSGSSQTVLSRFSAWLTADWVMPSRSAVLTTLPSSTKVPKTRSAVMSSVLI